MLWTFWEVTVIQKLLGFEYMVNGIEHLLTKSTFYFFPKSLQLILLDLLKKMY